MQRKYKCWVKGKKELTETIVIAPNAQMAAIWFAARNGVKSFNVKAVWQRNA